MPPKKKMPPGFKPFPKKGSPAAPAKGAPVTKKKKC